ncbi:MAG: type II toxin-antitoxin system PemK/MazF family toxin [Bacteroidetes bacterium]|nr:MAG: type II toxin-antitoxin system PemK/MazF family toxin [Bacteroidota bacterium]
MSQYKQGDIVIVPFPFTDLETKKTRPAVIVSTKGNFVLVPITSRMKFDEYFLPIRDEDVTTPLEKQSSLKINMIATIDEDKIITKISELKKPALEVVLESVKSILDIE